MKKVLCFGDSNTYGYMPASGARYPSSVRWTGILAQLLGSEYKVIEAGGNNRTAFTDSVDGDAFTGYKVLTQYLENDLSTVILAIGINDVQKFYNPTEEEIENGIEKLISIVHSKCPAAQIIMAAPSLLTEQVLKGNFSILFDKKSIENAPKITPIYKKTAERNGCKFVDLNQAAEVSKLDGLHYTPDGHKLIAQKIAGLI